MMDGPKHWDFEMLERQSPNAIDHPDPGSDSTITSCPRSRTAKRQAAQQIDLGSTYLHGMWIN